MRRMLDEQEVINLINEYGRDTQVQADWSQTDAEAVDYIKNKPALKTVATSGSYNDLTDKPTIPAAQVNADWNASSGAAEILNKPDLSGYQTTANLVTSISSASTDTQYPSAKLLYDTVGDIESLLAAI